MKSLKDKIKSLFPILIFGVLLVTNSCSWFSSKSDNDEYAEGNKATLYIKISSNVRKAGRTIKTDAFERNQFTDLELKGKYSTSENEEVLLTAESLEDLAASVSVNTGAWDFTLSAKYNGILFSDTKSYTVKSEGKNKVSFLLSAVEDFGGCVIKFTFMQTTVEKALVSLQSVDGRSILNKVEVPVVSDESPKICEFKKSPASAEERLASGKYLLAFDFYGASDVLLNHYESYMVIAAGQIASANINLDLNAIYSITYKDDAEPVTEDLVGSGLLISSYSKYSEFDLPILKKTGYIFQGWQKNGSGELLTKIEKNTYGNLSLTANFIEAKLYVSGTGDDTSGDGSQSNPFESIDKACEKIIEVGSPDAEWTIYIDGDVTGPHEGTRKAGSRNYSSDYGRSIIPVEITQEHAKSILLKGKNDPGETAGVPNAPTDMINRGLSSSSNSDTGSALVIATAVPVKVENLLIKNGCNKPANSSSDPYSEKGGGLFITCEATVTLGYGVIISNNNAKTAGGGIYNAGTLFINGSAEISSNNCVDGGGICNTGHLYLGYEDSATEKEWTGSIKNNTSWRGAGIKNLANAELVMSSGSVNHNSCANNSSTSGGGIWNMGSFTMTNGVIEFNDCCQGGGVYNGYTNTSEFGTFAFSGGKIKNNFANYVYGTNVSNGGGIYNTGVTYIYGEAIIGDETASSLPADNTGPQERDITNTSIDATCSNLALGLGGGIYVGAQGKLFLGYSRYVDATDNTPAVWNKGIYYNYAKEGGGGIAYGPSAKAVIFNSGTVSFNGATSNGAAAYIGADGFVLGGTATIPAGNGEGSPKQTVHVRTNNFSLNIDNDLSHLDTGAIALLPQDNSNSSTPVPTSYNTYKPLIKLTDAAVANGVTINSIKGKFTVENFTDPTSGRITEWSIDSEGKAQIETSAGFSASLDTGTADIVVFRNGNSFTPPIVESASSTSTICLDVKKIAGKDFDKSTMTLVWTFDGEELNRASMPEAVSFRYSESDRQIDIKSGMLTKGTYDVSLEATYNSVKYSFTTQIIKN